MLKGTFDSSVISIHVVHWAPKRSRLFTPFHTLRAVLYKPRGSRQESKPVDQKWLSFYRWGVILSLAGFLFLEASVFNLLAKTPYRRT